MILRCSQSRIRDTSGHSKCWPCGYTNSGWLTAWESHSRLHFCRCLSWQGRSADSSSWLLGLSLSKARNDGLIGGRAV